jgi:hypothetical protein
MQRLQRLQSTLDGTDISHVAQRFATECPQSELFDPALLAQPSAEELRQFVDLYLSDPGAGKSDKWSLRESIVAYALSATFKDCSIFITCRLVSTPAGWKLDEAEATVKVIDLDLKPVSSMKKWYDLDEKIWRHWAETKVTPSSESIQEPQPYNQLDTPIQITRGAIPSRLASSSTEALFIPTPDRQLNDPLDHIGATPSIGRGIRSVSGLDASSTRALHTRTPEDSQPSTPTAAATSIAATPASMSLSDALFLSPPPAATPPAPTPGSVSLSDGISISPSAAAPASHINATPASMSLSDVLHISPSNAMTYAEDNRTHIPTLNTQDSGSDHIDFHGHDGDEEVTDSDALKPDTPKRTTRSAGPSPSPGLVATASTLPEILPSTSVEEPVVSAIKVSSSPSWSTTEGTIQKEMGESSPLLEDPTPLAETSAALPVVEETINEDRDMVSNDSVTNPTQDDDPPSTTLADKQQHFRSVLAGIDMESPDKPETVTVAPQKDDSTTPKPDDRQHSGLVHAGISTESTDEPVQAATVPATDLPAIPTADHQQHFRAVLAGIETDKEDDQVPAKDLLTNSGADKEEVLATAGLADVSRLVEAEDVPQVGPGLSTSTDLEDTGMTPPFVTPMGFGDEVEPTYSQLGNGPDTTAVEMLAEKIPATATNGNGGAL